MSRAPCSSRVQVCDSPAARAGRSLRGRGRAGGRCPGSHARRPRCRIDVSPTSRTCVRPGRAWTLKGRQAPSCGLHRRRSRRVPSRRCPQAVRAARVPPTARWQRHTKRRTGTPVPAAYRPRAGAPPIQTHRPLRADRSRSAPARTPRCCAGPPRCPDSRVRRTASPTAACRPHSRPSRAGKSPCPAAAAAWVSHRPNGSRSWRHPRVV